MLTPEYLQSVPDAMVELYAQAEADILADMARRINGFDMFIPSAQYQMQMLEEMGALRSDIVRELSRLTGKSKKEITAIMREAGMETMASDEEIYKAAGLSSSPAAASPAVQEVLAAGLKKTGGLFTNLTKTTANTATKQFERALDRAYMQISSGAIDPATAIKNAIKSLAKDGVGAITYPSGHVDSLEVAVRRAVITGVNQTCGKMQEARADELGCDLMELTAHAGARPSHAEWQGQIVSRSGRPGYLSLDDIGYGTGAGFKGWNCSHDWRPYFEGMPRTYSKELLDSYESKEYEYNGRKMTEYEALQQQRSIERQIRRWKRENVAMKAAGLDTTESAAKIAKWQGVQNDFISQTGLKRQAEREHIFSTATVKFPPGTKKIADMQIGRSLGAKSRNYEVVDKETGIIYNSLEGSRIQNSEVFAGKGVKKPLRQEVAQGLADEFGGKPSDWQHAKGIANLVCGSDGDEIRTAEVHWFQASGVGKVKFKVKRWLDEG